MITQPMNTMVKEVWWAELFIDLEFSKLFVLEAAIHKWHDVANEEFSTQVEKTGGQDALSEQEYDYFADKAMLIQGTECVMYANLSVSINSFVENYLKSVARSIEIDISKDNSVPAIWDKLGKCLSFDRETLIGYSSSNKARVWGNKFKHNSGRKDKEFVNLFGGTEDEEIKYENEDWHSIIMDVQNLLKELARLHMTRKDNQGT